MCLEVSYTPYVDSKTQKSVTKPVIPVVIEHLGKEIKCLGLVDSGADYSLFNAEYADGLGLPVERGSLKDIRGISGSLKCREQEVTLKFLSGKHFKKIKGKRMFSRKYKRPFALLGRDTIFKLYEITFNEKEKLFVFKKIRK